MAVDHSAAGRRTAGGGGCGGDQASVKRVKLLCSFGGRILPRPGDGVLRYVGGDTRIISVSRDVSFLDLMLKMTDSCATGSSLSLKYQLPDEDLDALISVSSPEDLDNMMEEYDKLTASQPDGSPKLRAFIFSPSDLNSSDYSGFDGGSPGGVKRKESIESAESSTQNSNAPAGAEIVDTGSNEGMSPALLLPVVDASNLGFSMGLSDGGVGLSDSVQTLNLAPETPSAPPAPVYVDPHQSLYMHPQTLGIAGGSLAYSGVPFASYQYLPAVQSTSPTSQISNLKPVQTMAAHPYMEENSHGTRIQHLAQHPAPPLTYVQSLNAEQYGFNQALLQGKMMRLVDCLMCQKALPHVHSDTVVQNQGNGSPGAASETSPLFYSLRTEDPMRLRAEQLATRGLNDSVVIPEVEHSIPAGQLGTHRLPKIENCNWDRPVLQKRDNLDHSAAISPPNSMGIYVDPQSPHGMFFRNNQQPFLVDPWQQQLLQQSQQITGSPQYPAEQESITQRPVIGASPVVNGSFQASQHLMQATVPKLLYENLRRVDGIMDMMSLSPAEPSGFNEQWKAVTKPHIGTPMELKPDSSQLALENRFSTSSQAVGNGTFSDIVFAHPGTVPERNDLVKPINLQPSSPFDAVPVQNLQPYQTIKASYMIGDLGAYPQNLGVELGHPVPSGRLLGIPAYSYDIDSPCNEKTIKDTPNVNWGAETLQLQKKDMINCIPGIQSWGFLHPLSNTISPTGLAGPYQESVSSESLLYNEDPRKALGCTDLLPPRPTQVANKVSASPKNTFISNHLGNRNGLDIIALLEEGALHNLSEPFTKDFCPTPIQPAKGSGEKYTEQELQALAEAAKPVQSTKGSGEKYAEQELQAVVEAVAASALPSAILSVPSSANGTGGHDHEFNKEMASTDDNAVSLEATELVDKKDMKAIFSDNNSPYLHVTEGIGCLQIIKNGDLEELEELGSGTFGTVYHGKWRGSDVAIKRINDRCFAGKASEQERMRHDFWNEASKLADLHHPNVVAFYGVVLDGPGGSVATVTEYMVNGSLRNALQRNVKVFDRRRFLLIAMDVAFGMEYLHGKNIIHFDLKSDNLLVNLRDPQRPICKVGDLGLSKVKCKTLISGGVRGTLPWMAPELLNGSSCLVSEKVDVFSYGIVMWELLTGEEPYADLHYGAILGGIVSNTLRPPVPESCDPEWGLLMEECWSSEPLQRPSFTEVVNRLRSMAARLPQKRQT